MKRFLYSSIVALGICSYSVGSHAMVWPLMDISKIVQGVSLNVQKGLKVVAFAQNQIAFYEHVKSIGSMGPMAMADAVGNEILSANSKIQYANQTYNETSDFYTNQNAGFQKLDGPGGGSKDTTTATGSTSSSSTSAAAPTVQNRKNAKNYQEDLKKSKAEFLKSIEEEYFVKEGAKTEDDMKAKIARIQAALGAKTKLYVMAQNQRDNLQERITELEKLEKRTKGTTNTRQRVAAGAAVNLNGVISLSNSIYLKVAELEAYAYDLLVSLPTKR